MMFFGVGALGLIFMLVIWGAVIAVGMWVLSNTFPRSTDPPSSPHARGAGNGYRGASEPPLEILDRRYAAGELSRLEYDTMRGDLEA